LLFYNNGKKAGIKSYNLFGAEVAVEIYRQKVQLSFMKLSLCYSGSWADHYERIRNISIPFYVI